MTYITRGVDAYRRTEATSRSPLELVVLLYDGALRFVSEARDGMAHGDMAARGRGVSKAMAIVAELQCTLNIDGGGEVARQLDAMYTYITGRLIDTSTKRDAAALDEVHRLLSTMRDAWTQIAQPSDASAGAR